jgi:hypothetical protein
VPAVAGFQRDKTEGAHEDDRGTPGNEKLFLMFFVWFWKFFFHIQHTDIRPRAIHATKDHQTASPIDMRPRLDEYKALKIIAAVFWGAPRCGGSVCIYKN